MSLLFSGARDASLAILQDHASNPPPRKRDSSVRRGPLATIPVSETSSFNSHGLCHCAQDHVYSTPRSKSSQIVCKNSAEPHRGYACNRRQCQSFPLHDLHAAFADHGRICHAPNRRIAAGRDHYRYEASTRCIRVADGIVAGAMPLAK